MFRTALSFFTRIPVGTSQRVESLSGLAVWLPFVGAIVGLLVALFIGLAQYIFPPVICGVLGCAAWVGLTGGLHLDGVADCGDGLVVETSRERRLEIMRDSRLGTFGAVTLFFTLAFKIAALVYLVSINNFWYLVLACVFAGVLARSMIFMAMTYPSARPGGLGEAIREGTKRGHIVIAILFVGILCLIAGLTGWVAVIAAILATRYLLAFAEKRIGGVTGDVYGCLIETIEWIVLLVFCIK